MSEAMVPIIIVPAIFFAFYAIIKTISDNAVRRKLVDKGLVDENTKYLFQGTRSSNVPESLKWGMVLVAVGAAVLIGQIVPTDFRDEATLSGMFILGGLALIVYYFIASKVLKQSD